MDVASIPTGPPFAPTQGSSKRTTGRVESTWWIPSRSRTATRSTSVGSAHGHPSNATVLRKVAPVPTIVIQGPRPALTCRPPPAFRARGFPGRAAFAALPPTIHDSRSPPARFLPLLLLFPAMETPRLPPADRPEPPARPPRGDPGGGAVPGGGRDGGGGVGGARAADARRGRLAGRGDRRLPEVRRRREPGDHRPDRRPLRRDGGQRLGLGGGRGPGRGTEARRLPGGGGAAAGRDRQEANPALLALQATAAARGVSFLADDRTASVGLGKGSLAWPVRALPDPADGRLEPGARHPGAAGDRDQRQDHNGASAGGDRHGGKQTRRNHLDGRDRGGRRGDRSRGFLRPRRRAHAAARPAGGDGHPGDGSGRACCAGGSL